MTEEARKLSEKSRLDFDDLCRITRLLRAEGGCLWDRAQTHASVRSCVIEEAYEVVEAIDRNDSELLCEELGDLLRRSGIPLYGAALRDDTEDVRALDLRRCAIAIGSEGRGLSRELLDICGGELIIPMNPHSESLNAAIAASVIMWEMSR